MANSGGVFDCQRWLLSGEGPVCISTRGGARELFFLFYFKYAHLAKEKKLVGLVALCVYVCLWAAGMSIKVEGVQYRYLCRFNHFREEQSTTDSVLFCFFAGGCLGLRAVLNICTNPKTKTYSQQFLSSVWRAPHWIGGWTGHFRQKHRQTPSKGKSGCVQECSVAITLSDTSRLITMNKLSQSKPF